MDHINIAHGLKNIFSESKKYNYHWRLDEGLHNTIKTLTGFRQAQPDSVLVIVKNITLLLFVP